MFMIAVIPDTTIEGLSATLSCKAQPQTGLGKYIILYHKNPRQESARGYFLSNGLRGSVSSFLLFL